MYTYLGKLVSLLWVVLRYAKLGSTVTTRVSLLSSSSPRAVTSCSVRVWIQRSKLVTLRCFLPAIVRLQLQLWDVYHEGNCLRTFMGHSQALKDIAFNNKGDKFLSASYDRYIKQWDTETGQCIQVFSNGKIPNCVTYNPDGDKQNIFLAGMQDKKIIQVSRRCVGDSLSRSRPQYDLRMREIVQTYDQHLGPVNTITFMDENRRFVTTSDDKSIRGWDYDIPVVIKYIAEPHMHSMPAVSMHPSSKSPLDLAL